MLAWGTVARVYLREGSGGNGLALFVLIVESLHFVCNKCCHFGNVNFLLA